MGIRVHKIIGYGLTDVKSDKYSIADPRFTKKFINGYKEDVWLTKDYLNWLKQKPQDFEVKYEIVRVKHWTDHYLGSCFTHDAEFGLSKIFLVVPIYFLPEWRRYDDLIDYCEEENRFIRDQKAEWYEILKNGIYPFNMKPLEIPDCVKFLCEYCKVFKNKKTINQLQPMIYVYWS